MSQPTLFASVQWTVTALTRHLRGVLESDPALQDVWVTGEISNLSRPTSGHLYFTLKDAGASLRCVMWKTDAARMKLALQDGLAVEAHGRITIYEPAGQYQLVADLIRPTGEGALYQEFLRLKAVLEAEGLFDPERKRPIPELPRRIGIVTSPSGAALRDMLDTIRRRYPLADVVLAPSPVQGVDAPAALVAGLRGLNRLVRPDVILLARGGGSIEDLWAFNDELVVRAVAESEAPVISGVGHETDFTLCDFAADLRAPTPTAAAELATPITLIDLSAGLANYQSRIANAIVSLINQNQIEVSNLETRLRYFSPARRIQTDRQRLDDLARRALTGLVHRAALESTRLKGLARRLEALSPLAVLERGYALVTRAADGGLVTRVAEARAGASLRVRVSDGQFGVTVAKPKSVEEA
ncbi:MAG: exodeoxyribonuclease VII large subunit [Chloroflexota bacterium]